MSDCGTHALSLIAFVGSVFSPFYASARRRGGAAADPEAHCALNVALYRRDGGSGGGSGSGGAWALTEHRRADMRRSAGEFRLGASRLAWQGHALQVDVDERTAPLRRPLRGSLRLAAPALVDRRYALDAGGRHHWHPIAPCARMEVFFSRPALRWQGSAYLDSNTGSRPMEDDFVRWDWLRAPLADGRTAVLYDGLRRDGTPFSIAQAFDGQGQAAGFALVPPAAPPIVLPASRWGVPRRARGDHGARAHTVQALEDGPFYARGLLATRLAGEDVTAVHESLSLDRFRARWVQALLPFRMRRMGHWLP